MRLASRRLPLLVLRPGLEVRFLLTGPAGAKKSSSPDVAGRNLILKDYASTSLGLRVKSCLRNS
jgi:hypothetical protein